MENIVKHWKEEEIQFLKINYPLKGVKFCSDKLNKSYDKIYSKVAKLKLKVNKETKLINRVQRDNNTRYEYSQFFDCKIPEFCYLLGYLWADGHIHKSGISMEINKDDALIVKSILDYLDIHYTLYQRKQSIDSRGVPRNAQYTFGFGINFKLFLESLNYDKKSYISHKKVIEYIPKENLHYWMRGYFDGDGCFYFNKNLSLRQGCFSSSYEQDWNYLFLFLVNLEMTPKIKLSNKKTKSSAIRFTGKKNTIIFGNYIYQGKQFGLDRKYQKYLLIRSS